MLCVDAVGAAPLEEVWRRYTEPGSWSSWAPQIARVTSTGQLDDSIAPGDHGWVVGPLGVRVPFRIVAMDPERRSWQWRVGVGRAAITMDHGVDNGAGRTRAWVRIHLPRAIARPYAPIARRALIRLVSPAA